MTAILGISAFYHDAAAALVVDGDIVAAAQEERFSRRKHDPSFPSRAVAYCLEEAGLASKDLDHVVNPRYSYLASRADLSAIAGSAAAQGRSWSTHVTDDLFVEEMAMLLKSPDIVRRVFGTTEVQTDILTSAPNHIVAVRTPGAKLPVYSYWKPGGMEID